MSHLDPAEWDKPQSVSDLELAFPAHVEHLMPSREHCEAALATIPPDEAHKWLQFQRAWFSKGLNPDTVVELYDGIDGEAAFRHLQAIQGSFQPKHEHKEAAVAYLCSRWFADARNYSFNE